jgi:hypothetical protein
MTGKLENKPGEIRFDMLWNSWEKFYWKLFRHTFTVLYFSLKAIIANL